MNGSVRDLVFLSKHPDCVIHHKRPLHGAVFPVGRGGRAGGGQTVLRPVLRREDNHRVLLRIDPFAAAPSASPSATFTKKSISLIDSSVNDGPEATREWEDPPYSPWARPGERSLARLSEEGPQAGVLRSPSSYYVFPFPHPLPDLPAFTEL